MKYGNFYISSTGTIHHGIAPSSFGCNSGGGKCRRVFGRLLSDQAAALYQDHAFCKKCFPKGPKFRHLLDMHQDDPRVMETQDHG